MPSANLDDAVATAVKARIINNGQSCIAAQRFIVSDSVYDNFKQAFVARMEAIKVGDPMDRQTELGPLSTAGGLQTLDDDVRASIKLGARALTGGGRMNRPGNFYSPAVLESIPENSPAYTEELFG